MIEYISVWEANPASFEDTLDLMFRDGWEPMPETLYVKWAHGEGFYGFIILQRSEERAAAFGEDQ